MLSYIVHGDVACRYSVSCSKRANKLKSEKEAGMSKAADLPNKRARSDSDWNGAMSSHDAKTSFSSQSEDDDRLNQTG